MLRLAVLAYLTLSAACGFALIAALVVGLSSPPPPTLAFVARTSSRDLYLIDLQRQLIINITHTPTADESSPDWSPEGTALIYVLRDSGGSAIDVQHLRSRARDRLTQLEGELDTPVWSPDGRWIAFVTNGTGAANRKLYLMTPEGENLRRLTFNRSEALNPSWSPDSQQIAFISQDQNGQWKIFARTAEARTDLRLLVNAEGNVFAPAWSPEAHTLAYAIHRSIIVTDLENGQVRELYHAGQATIGQLDWSPDGTQLAFSAWEIDADGTYQSALYRLNADGTGLRRLTPPDMEAIQPAWRP